MGVEPCEDFWGRCGWVKRAKWETYPFGGIELFFEFFEFFVSAVRFLIDLAVVMECLDVHLLCLLRKEKDSEPRPTWSDSSSMSSLSWSLPRKKWREAD